jgi:hypothetical protein
MAGTSDAPLCDVEWSRRYGRYLFHLLGFGGGHVVTGHGIYHASGDVRIKERALQWVSARDR